MWCNRPATIYLLSFNQPRRYSLNLRVYPGKAFVKYFVCVLQPTYETAVCAPLIGHLVHGVQQMKKLND